MKPRHLWKQPKRSPLKLRTSWLNSSAKPIRARKKRTAVREREKFAREFGSVERVEFVKTLPCVIGILCQGRMENMHTKGDGGSRRGPHTSIVPACTRHHHQSHNGGQQTLAAKWGIDWEQEAAATERAWQEHLSMVV